MQIRFIYLITVLFSVSFFSCRTSYQGQSMQYKKYQISTAIPVDSSMIRFLKPFSDSVNNSMNMVLGVAGETLEKELPECSLGNFMVDAFLTMAREKYNEPVDVAVVNYGGIRLTQLPAGPVTRGKIFELMPFDNILILQKLKGTVLQQLADLSASRGGWPVAGMSLKIKSGKAVDVQIAGKPLDPEKIYTVANSDFMANGGDNADMLRSIPQISNGYLMRDALIDYVQKLTAKGQKIKAITENRVTNAQ